jgi:hypothetical protein
VYNDPVIVHQGNVNWGFGDDDELLRNIITARIKRLRTAPTDSPIGRATLPEAVAYLASASMDAGAATGNLPPLYHLAMREYLNTYGEETPEWLSEELVNEEHHQSQLNKLRRKIKREQDRRFIANRSEDLPLKKLSKSFWHNDECQT